LDCRFLLPESTLYKLIAILPKYRGRPQKILRITHPVQRDRYFRPLLSQSPIDHRRRDLEKFSVEVFRQLDQVCARQAAAQGARFDIMMKKAKRCYE